MLFLFFIKKEVLQNAKLFSTELESSLVIHSFDETLSVIRWHLQVL